MKDLSRLEITDYRLEESKEKAKLFQKQLETYLTENNNEREIVIKTRYIEPFNIDDNHASELMKNEHGAFFLQEINKATKINGFIKISNLLKI